MPEGAIKAIVRSRGTWALVKSGRVLRKASGLWGGCWWRKKV